MAMRSKRGACIWLGVVASLLVPRTGSGGDLTGVVSVAECVRVALEEHPRLAAATAALESSSARVRQTRAGFLPQVDGAYAVTRQQQTFSSLVGGPTGGGGALGVCIGGTNDRALCSTDLNCPGGLCRIAREVSATQSEQFTFQRSGFSLQQLLFDFGRTLFDMRAAMASRDAASAGRDTVAQDVVLNVKRTYYDLITAQRLVVVAEETEAQTRRQLEEARSRHEVGAAPRFDVTQQEVQVADAELARLQAKNAVALGRENLRDAMGLTEPIAFEPDDRTLDQPRRRIDEQRALERAFVRRPELRDVRARIRAGEQRVAALRTDYLPAVNGLGSYTWTGDDRPEDESWVVGANITLSIFNGGRTMAQIGELRADVVRAQAEERQERQRVALEVRQAVLNIHEAEDSVHVSEKQVGQARESLQIAEGRYSAGVGNILEVTLAQVDLARARANYVRTLADYWIFVAQLERAVGEGSEETSGEHVPREDAAAPGGEGNDLVRPARLR
jgi:outer membrane protein